MQAILRLMQRLYGRETEVQRLVSLLASARAGVSTVLVLRGEPGIGKTALIQRTVELADGMTVLQARGRVVETQLAFSGLSDLFAPILDRLAAIPPRQSAALAGALGVGPPFPGDRFVVCVATMSLLAAAAEVRPVLAIVDDSQWLDQASSEALLFAGRRLEAERVSLLMASLELGADADAAVGFDDCILSGLNRQAASKLLGERVPQRIAPQVIDRLVEVTGGNPLALCDIAANLSEAQLIGASELGEPLPAAASVERAFLRRVERFGAATRQGLLVVAASSGITSTIVAACEALHLPPTSLEPAEEEGVIRSDDGRT